METRPSAPKISWGAVAGIVVLALVGVAMLTYSLIALFGAPETPEPTAVALQPATQPPVVIPTVTQPPAPTQAPTSTGGSEPRPDTPPPPAATDTPAQQPTGPVLNILQPANVRSGPGINYPVIGGLQAGATAPLLGRDASAQWFVISYSAGQGWVSSLISSYGGDVNGLPVIAAPPSPPPPPPPTNTAPPANTAPPPTSPPPSGYIADGVRGDEFSIRNTTVGAGQDIWFDFTVTNTTDDTIRYGVLAAHTDVGFTAQSWTNASLRPRAVLEWTDHININTPGTYQIYLGICFSDKPSCLSGASWERLSNSITVVVQ